MPEGWSRPRDLAKLADARAQFDLSIPLGDLPGIPAEFGTADGPVRAWLHFGREQGLAIAQVRLTAALRAVCQRCLGEMRLDVSAESRLAIVDNEAQVGRVPEEFETFLAPDGYAALAALVAEELLLALPLVPRHATGESCLAAAAEVQPAAAAEETQRPFADLRSLLERGRN
jgi:uncharacterized protein